MSGRDVSQERTPRTSASSPTRAASSDATPPARIPSSFLRARIRFRPAKAEMDDAGLTGIRSGRARRERQREPQDFERGAHRVCSAARTSKPALGGHTVSGDARIHAAASPRPGTCVADDVEPLFVVDLAHGERA